MEIIEINEDNLGDYEELIGADAAANIGREYYRGVALHENRDDMAKAALVWEYKNLEEDEDTFSEIICLAAGNARDTDELMGEYDRQTSEESVVKSFFEFGEDKEKETKLLKKNGFSVKKHESRDLYVTIGDMSGIKSLDKKAPPYIAPIGELMVRQFRKGIMNCLFHNRKGLLEDMATLPISWYEQDISCCVQTDGSVNGFLLIHKSGSGVLVVDLLCCFGPDYKLNLRNMMRFSLAAARKKYPPETRILLRRHNDAAFELVKLLFPDAGKSEAFYGEREEGR